MLLKFQKDFLNSKAKIKIWRKSRQIGATWTSALDVCLKSGEKEKPLDSWFSSTNADASKLFIKDVSYWAKKIDAGILEVFGMPIRLGKYGNLATDEDRKQLLKAVANIGTDAAAVISEDMNIEFVNAKVDGNATMFTKYIDYLDAQVSKIVLGQTMTTDEGSSQAQANIYQITQDYIKKSDCLQIEQTINDQLIKRLVDYNFGIQKEYPKIEFITEREDSKRDLAESLSKVAPYLTNNISASDIAERLGFKNPKDENDKLSINTNASLENQQLGNKAQINRILHLNSQHSEHVEEDEEEEQLTQKQIQAIDPMIEDISKLLDESEDIEDALKKLETTNLNTTKLEAQLLKDSLNEYK